MPRPLRPASSWRRASSPCRKSLFAEASRPVEYDRERDLAFVALAPSWHEKARAVAADGVKRTRNAPGLKQHLRDTQRRRLIAQLHGDGDELTATVNVEDFLSIGSPSWRETPTASRDTPLAAVHVRKRANVDRVAPSLVRDIDHPAFVGRQVSVPFLNSVWRYGLASPSPWRTQRSSLRTESTAV